MPAPKGHPPYPGCEKGGRLGYLGKPQDAYTQEDLKKLGQEMVDWFLDNPMEIWFDDFYIYRGVDRKHIEYLRNKYSTFNEYFLLAKRIQESRLNKYSFYKKADGAQARFILERSHEGYRNDQLEDTLIPSKTASRLISNLLKNKESE